ncbi:site-specific tyrosine recombinase XerC [Serratia entomophila]|nr:site-specific tyrosine recombinase XerC [Serratia entomophila]CAI1851256.1 site-specific tyrosine recombinase XerC [Serratia entomophila]CAI1855726.1 site-specific tyrosine recombinase XerC [Serratia entomophila]CAI1922808.1 site-specific tyrosine recombinase XerC [Serratia entomophila]CAI1953743.1 site-specific tyrosine recombinase XerC [Serratia entomophila]
MATLRKLPSGKWNAQVRIKGHPTQTKTFFTIDEAEKWSSDCEEKFKRSESTIKALSPVYLEEVLTKNGKPRGGYDSIRNRLVNLDKHFGSTSLEKITSENVATYKVERLKKAANGTVRLELQLLSRFLRWAASEKGVACNDVVKPVRLPEAGKPRDKILTPLQYQMILERVETCRSKLSGRLQGMSEAKAIIILAWETAMRRGEILALTPAMIDFRQRVIHLADHQTKNAEARDVPLSSVALDLLKSLCEGKKGESKLFTLRPYSVSQAFRRACRETRIEGVCFHSLRHTCITRYAEKGLNTIQLQCISGHKDITMLARYSHIKASSVAVLME